MPDETLRAAVTSLSWLPVEDVRALVSKAVLRLGAGHADPPPPDAISDLDDVLNGDGFRFAHVLSATATIQDGQVIEARYDKASRVVMGATTISVGPLNQAFGATALPAIRQTPEPQPDGSVRFIQTCGGYRAVPMPRLVPHPPFVQLQAPHVWTTLALTLRPDGRSHVELVDASVFPRHWVYGADGAVVHQSNTTDYWSWLFHSFGPRTPWTEAGPTA
jgi:hypothetical protein